MIRAKNKTYQGRCHCGFLTFSVVANIDHARVCNCSICSKRGTMNFRVPNDALTLNTPLDGLTLYQWGSKTAKDYFCPNCGILGFRRPSLPTKEERERGTQPFEGWTINLRCIDDIDISTLPIVKIDGASL